VPYDALIAVVTLFYLIIFFSINAYYSIRGLRARISIRAYAELERPKNISVNLAALGTLVFFAEAILFVFLGLSGIYSQILVRPLQLSFAYDFHVRTIGLVIMGVGFKLFLWSVVARGRYSVSWEMPEDQRLVTWGPYRYVRHPSYLGYFLMFGGFFLAWLNLFALVPSVAIPGYLRLVETEEDLLIKRFGDEYVRYQKTSRWFLPRLGVKKRR
jgi:protein-S-isoprenylcysteine O-methyltransferase Ste14